MAISESSLFMLCMDTTFINLLSLSFGLWPLESGTNEIVAKLGTEKFGDFLKNMDGFGQNDSQGF